MIHIDSKITIWDRFSIDDEHKKELLKFINGAKAVTANDILDWINDNGYEAYGHETLVDTGEELTPAYNSGAATVEVLITRPNARVDTLWTNATGAKDTHGLIGEEKPWKNAPPMILEDTLERYEQIAADIKKEFLHDKHTGHWSWCDRGDGGVPRATGFPTRLAALLDAIEPYLDSDEEVED